MVVVTHALTMRLHWNGAASDKLQAGVDLFFVISGFIMWQTTARGGIGPAGFLWKRITRVMPLYWVATLLMFPLMFISNTMSNGFAFSIADLGASLFCVPLNGPDDWRPVYFPGWTINFEMLFYFIFAMCLVIGDKMRRATCLLLVLVALTSAGSLFEASPTLRWYTAPMILEFGAGVIIAMYYAKGTIIRREIAVGAIALGVVIVATCALRPAGDLVGSRLTTFGVAAALIVFGAVFLERCGGIAHSSFCKFWGDASYSMYLTHMFAINAVAMFWISAGLWTTELSLWIYLIVAFAVSLATAACCYRLIETPLLKFARSAHVLSPQDKGQANILPDHVADGDTEYWEPRFARRLARE